MHFTFGVSPYFTADGVAAAVFGGLVVGSTVAFKTGVVGEVLGVSGSTRGMIVKPAFGKAAFIIGLIVAGIITARTLGNMEPLPAPMHDGDADMRARIFARLAVGGFLVGFGTALGNGCTSGHGLTGLARLSLRSWVAVPVFMACAMITGTLSGTAEAFPADPASEMDAPGWQECLIWSISTIAVLAACALAAGAAAKRMTPESAEKAKVLGEFVAGLAFGVGLSVSTMTRPSKVAAFLDWRSGAWDPSLAFVMGGGLAVTFPFWQYFERRGPSSPLLGGAFGTPPRGKAVDRDLVIGAILFGIGWGACGVCPGPIWVLLGAVPTAEIVVVLAGLLLGMVAWRLFMKCRGAKSCPAAADAPEASKDAAMKDEATAPSEVENVVV